MKLKTDNLLNEMKVFLQLNNEKDFNENNYKFLKELTKKWIECFEIKNYNVELSLNVEDNNDECVNNVVSLGGGDNCEIALYNPEIIDNDLCDDINDSEIFNNKIIIKESKMNNNKKKMKKNTNPKLNIVKRNIEVCLSYLSLYNLIIFSIVVNKLIVFVKACSKNKIAKKF